MMELISIFTEIYSKSHLNNKLSNLRWRVKKFNDPNDWAGGEKFGFPSLKHPGAEQQLKQLELRLKSLVRDIEFRNFTDEFQDKLKRDVRMIKEAPKLIIEADKTTH